MTARRIAVVIAVMLIGAALQAELAARIHEGAARPDFLLIAIAVAGATTSLRIAIAAGFAGGLLMATLTGVNYGSMILSRIAAGGVAGFIGQTAVRDTQLNPVFGTILATAIAETIYYLTAPGVSPGFWARTTLGEMAYNAVLVVPFAWIARKIITAPRRPRRRPRPPIRNLPRRLRHR